MPQAKRLQDFLAGVDFFAAVPAGARGERHADGVADALLQQHGQRGGAPDLALHSHARLGKAEVQGLAGLGGEFLVELDEVTGGAGLYGNDDLVGTQAALDGKGGGFERGDDHALVHDFVSAFAQVAVGVLLHLFHDQLAVERAHVHPDAHGLVVVHRHLADGGKLLVALFALAHVAGVDAVFVERLGATRHLGEQAMAVVVEVANDGGRDPGVAHARYNLGHALRRARRVHGNAHQLGPGLGQLDALRGGRERVLRVGVGHRLHHHRRAAAHLHPTHHDGNRVFTLEQHG
ncbi:MAG: hypothetical protein JW395_2683 [Nitrospira sp.]|nr:hypothetical protein [Nitrospira sp.]